MKVKKLAQLAGTLALGWAGVAVAAPLGLYGAVIDKTSAACINYGDAVSCSAPLLNYLSGRSATAQTTDAGGGFIVASNQGALESYIVVQAGGGAQSNGDTAPAPALVENGFKSNDGGSDSFRATGKANGTTMVLGNMSDPVNNSLGAGDNPGTWDVATTWLRDALTVGGTRRELTIGFDYNQPQNSTTSLDFWGLVTLRDLQGGLADINFEIRNAPGSNYATFNTSKTFNSQPASTDFGTVNGVTCVDTNNSQAVPILPIPGGQCPAGYELALNNAQSTATTEIIAFLPELNAGLEQYIAQGYDVLSTRLLLGCFGGTPQGSFQPGVGYLSDSGTTNNCEGGGFADVFLMAGAPMATGIPEPGSLALVGLALAGLALRRRKAA